MGISRDTAETHQQFVSAQRLNFPLLADVDGSMSRAYGALDPDGVTSRVTYLVSKDGRVIGVDRDVPASFTQKGDELESSHGQDFDFLLSDWKASIGQRLPNFWLPALDGKPQPIFSKQSRATLMVYLSLNDAKGAVGFEFARLASTQTYQGANITIVARDPANSGWPAWAKAQGVSVLKPAISEFFDRLSLRSSGSAILIDRTGTVRYLGIASSQNAGGSTINYAKEALDAVLTGRPVSVFPPPVSPLSGRQHP